MALVGPTTVNVEVLIEVGFMALVNVAVTNEATGTAVAPCEGAKPLTTGGDAGAGACTCPQPAITRIKRKARIEFVLTTGNSEIITLRMRLLFKLQFVMASGRTSEPSLRAG